MRLYYYRPVNGKPLTNRWGQPNANYTENDGVIERLRGTLRHKKANAWNKWIAMTLMMTTNNCNFQSVNGFARLNSSKNLKSYDYTFYGHRFGFFPRLPSRIVISCFLFSCAHIRAYHLRLLIDVYSFILIWLRGKQGKQLVHIIFVSLSFVNSLSSRSAYIITWRSICVFALRFFPSQFFLCFDENARKCNRKKMTQTRKRSCHRRY